MNSTTRIVGGIMAFASLLCIASCGGGDSGAALGFAGGSGGVVAAANVVPVVVDSGPAADSARVNTLYTTVTLCVPGSTTACQTIDHIQVDTGSVGLRLLGSALTLPLPLSLAPDGNTLVECTKFVDGYSWGPVAAADVQIGGEIANAVPVQVIGDANFTVVPAACSSAGPIEDTVAVFGANGILGIGVFEQDCGAGCVSDPAFGDYYACTPAGSCVGTVTPLSSQVSNPVTLFAVDNNGSILELPPVAPPGALTLTGSLIFGIDTQHNNASGSQSVLTLDPANGEFTTVYGQTSLPASFIDSGTNGTFFNDASIASCTDQGFTAFYCPAATEALSGTLVGQNGVSVTVEFSVANAQTLLGGTTFSVVPQLAGVYSSASNPPDPSAMSTFDWGLPFFYGRRVATAIENRSTAVDTGPYIAF